MPKNIGAERRSKS